MRYVDVFGFFDENLANKFISTINHLKLYGETIILFIDSEGGKTSALKSMIDCIKTSGVPVYGVALGNCYSCAFDLLQFCDKRFGARKASYLFHSTWTDDIDYTLMSYSFGERSILPKTEFDDVIYLNFSRRMGLSVKEIEYMADSETWWTSSENALREGVIDSIWEINQKEA